MTIAYDVNNASLIIQDGAENADVRRNTLAEKVTLAYHRNPTDYVLRSPNVERDKYAVEESTRDNHSNGEVINLD